MCVCVYVQVGLEGPRELSTWNLSLTWETGLTIAFSVSAWSWQQEPGAVSGVGENS